MAQSQWIDPSDSLEAGSTPIRATHMKELRNAIDNKRVLCGLVPFDWEDPSLIPGQTTIRTVHINQLRAAIQEVYDKAPARSLPFGSWTDPTIEPGVTAIRLAHFTELRAAFEQATCCGDGECNGSEDTVSCPDDCNCNYGPWGDAGAECGTGGCDPNEKLQQRIDLDGTIGCVDKFQCVVNLVSCCSYSDWADVGCGLMDCGPSGMAQKATAQAGCPDVYRCIADHGDCCSYAAEDSVIGCGLGDCEDNEVLWGKAVIGGLDCPMDPDAVCQPDENYSMDCCEYPGFQDVECGGEGGVTGVNCPDDQMYQVNTPAVGASSYCPLQGRCLLSDQCCGYGAYTAHECGAPLCLPNQVRETSTPTYPSAVCPVLERCSVNDLLCCNYVGYVNQGCGAPNCAYNEIYEVNLSPGTDCEPLTRCTLDEATCCDYTGMVAQYCGNGQCAANEVYYLNQSQIYGSMCPSSSQCVLNEMDCCGEYTGFQDVSCGVNPCLPNQMLQANNPTVPGSECQVFTQCVTNDEACCGGYTDFQYQGCGENGDTVNCQANEKLMVNSPIDADAGCDSFERCDKDEGTCCGGYGDWVQQGCGQNGCAPHEISEVQLPGDAASGCEERKRCVTNYDFCCGGEYTGWVNQGCGGGSCPLYAQLQTNTPTNPASTCPDFSPRCFSDPEECCGGYGTFYGECGQNGCAANAKMMYNPYPPDSVCGTTTYGCTLNEVECCGYQTVTESCGLSGPGYSCGPNQKLLVSTPTVSGSACDVKYQCVQDDLYCCEGYTGYQPVECGGGTCAQNQMYKVNQPNDSSSGCPDYPPQCVTDNNTCCDYEANREEMGCHLGTCEVNEMQIKKTAPDCPEVLTCEQNVACYECVPGGGPVPCMTPEGCFGTHTCSSIGTWEECIQGAIECTEGQERSCTNSSNAPSYQFCLEGCGQWGPCECNYGSVRDCTTAQGCPGTRTCFNNIWEACQQVETICVPNDTADCTTASNLAGQKTCDSCGSAWGGCTCIPGNTLFCSIDGCSGTRSCTPGEDWDPCVKNNPDCGA